ncbi:MAG: cobyrinic acid a,c-diamide synthase, partial [Nitrospirae bacterium]|nr:cobyrinic acid a,c-diamide synthase [Nitrospirota bacterium]
MKRGKGILNGMDGAVYKNVLAAYTHVHVLGTPIWAEGFIRAGIEYKNKK